MLRLTPDLTTGRVKRFTCNSNRARSPMVYGKSPYAGHVAANCRQRLTHGRADCDDVTSADVSRLTAGSATGDGGDRATTSSIVGRRILS
jgi:hypothetical protein